MKVQVSSWVSGVLANKICLLDTHFDTSVVVVAEERQIGLRKGPGTPSRTAEPCKVSVVVVVDTSLVQGPELDPG